ncbi:MAG: DUF5665 domain-containing protein [bacterium]|nr:DUF5665 domain-containing protein [bacterium]
MNEQKRGVDAIYRSKRQIVTYNFLGGIAWGVGTAIGATTIVAILAFFMSQINFIPGIGSFVAQVINAVNQYNQSSPFSR